MPKNPFSPILIALLLGAASAYAQYTPHSPQHSYMNMHNYNIKPKVSVKYDFKVVMKNDSTFTAWVKIDIDEKKHFINVRGKGGKSKIYPDQTKWIVRKNRDGKIFKGVPTDSCWLFKCHDGMINCYSFVAESGLTSIIAIQAGETGPIEPLTQENLSRMMATDNPRILRMLAMKDFAGAIKIYEKN